MCFCSIADKIGLLQAGHSMDGTLRFLYSVVMIASVVRLLVHWTFGV